MLEIKKQSRLSLFQKPGNHTCEFGFPDESLVLIRKTYTFKCSTQKHIHICLLSKEIKNLRTIIVTIPPLLTRHVESHGGQAWTNPIAPSVHQRFLWKSGCELWHIQNGIFDLDCHQKWNFVFLLHFCTWQCFVNFTHVKHRKRLSWGKLIIINCTLSNIDNTKPSRKLGAIWDEFIFYF